MSRVVALIGPTAVGKTALSLEVAKKLEAEIISVDSRQVYRYMDVGTEKVSPAERREVPHHMIDIADPDEPFSVSDFVDKAVAAARRITDRGRVPLFVGGTPFYYNALFHSCMNVSLPHNQEVREKWEAFADSDGAEALHSRLSSIDPATASRLHPNDVRRVSRALELWELTGTPPSQLYSCGEKLNFGFDVLYIGLNRSREELFKRIDKRLSKEFASGFPEEVAWLIEHGFDERFPPMRGFGYRELAAHYRGSLTMDEALETAAYRTHAFCRRQMTWFGKFSPAIWYDISGDETGASVMRDITDAAMRHLDADANCETGASAS